MNHEIDLKKYDIHTDLVLDTIENNEFDINPYLLNAQNGVIDLRDGTIQPHNKNFYMSKICSYNCEMNLKPNLWNKFIRM